VRSGQDQVLTCVFDRVCLQREGLPPGFASNNEFALSVESSANWSTVICRPREPEKVYYGLYGGETRAEYDVSQVCSHDSHGGVMTSVFCRVSADHCIFV